jgi:hypothetical protein
MRDQVQWFASFGSRICWHLNRIASQSADTSRRQRTAASGSPMGPASPAVASFRNVITSAPSAS